MKINLVKKLLHIFMALCSIPVAFSQQQQDSLMIYLDIAAKNNPDVLQKLYEYQAALQKVPQVSSLPDPELNVGVFLSPMELINGNQVAEIKLMQMFPWFGVRKNAKDEMGLMAKGKYESFRDAKLQVYFDVKSTWYELYKIQQNIRISEKNIGILRSLERISLAKFRAGPSGGGVSVGTMGQSSGNQGSGGSGLTDIYRIQIEIGDLENNIAWSKNQQNTQIARFNSFLNRPVQSPVSFPDTLQAMNTDIPLLAVSDSMFTNNPMLGMLQYEQQSLEARKKMISRMGYPMVGLGLNYSLINKKGGATPSMNGQDMMMPMVTVTLPIYRKKYKAMQTEADLMKSATEQGYKATANSLQTDYQEAVQLYQDAKRRIKLYENQSLLAKKSLDIMIKSFSASGSDLTDILRIRQQLFDYELKQIEAVTDYNTAIARLERLTSFSQIQ